MSETTGSKINPSISSASPLEAIDHVISEWHLLKHPFYQDWMAGKTGIGDAQGLRDPILSSR